MQVRTKPEIRPRREKTPEKQEQEKSFAGRDFSVDKYQWVMVLTLLRGAAPRLRLSGYAGQALRLGVGKKEEHRQAVIGRDNGFFCG